MVFVTGEKSIDKFATFEHIVAKNKHIIKNSLTMIFTLLLYLKT